MNLIPEIYLPAVVTVGILALLICFAFEVRPPEVCAIALLAIFMACGVLSADDLLEAVGNPAPMTIASMFILSSALVRTGLLDALAHLVTDHARRRPNATVAFLLALIAMMSAFTNNTPLVMMMIPVGISLANQLGEAPSKILMPISFAAILGGTCSLIGTSTNLLVDGVATKAGLEPFGIFSIAPVGIPVAIVGVIFLVIGRYRLPSRYGTTQGLTDSRRFNLSIAIAAGSSLIGNVATAVSCFARGQRRLVDVIRVGHSQRDNLGDVRLQEGDIVVLRSSIDDVLTIKDSDTLTLATQVKDDFGEVRQISQSQVVELLVMPDTLLLGHRISELSLWDRYGVYPIALHRRGSNLAERFEETVLEAGDAILFEGSAEAIERMALAEKLLNFAAPKGRGFRPSKAPIALGVLVSVVALAGLDILPLPALAMIGVAVVLVTRCVEPDEAFSAVDWRIIALIIAMLALGTAIEKAALIENLVGFFSPHLTGMSILVSLAAIYIVTLILTELVTNNAVAVIMTPIAISLGNSLQIDPRPLIVAVMFAASASFLTPIGYQTNTIIYNAGGYRFTDYTRFGFPLTFAVCITTIMSIWFFMI